ncbi:YqhG family protein [Paenibacillus pinihumi]|uniref:YqhG family protein n=1 Tax=Paenibacillus pinihumi TaxID=669462 RepID=UPI00041B859F|nr:YqhG family protein [Paenibacillus pinihumi]
MNQKQVHRYLQQYLEATNCHVIEKSPAHFTVKLSPEADRILTNRPYYWSFVDRTGAEPETMSFLFVTDKEKYDAQANQDPGSEPSQTTTTAPAATAQTAGQMNNQVNQALARSYGIVPTQVLAMNRIPRDDVHFGSKRLKQLFAAAQDQGSYVYLFQEPDSRSRNPFDSTPYTPWLGINVKVEFQCDRKREELYSFGVSMATGNCVEQFHQQLNSLKMTPRLPANVHIAPAGISLKKAVQTVEAALERKLKAQSYEWAEEAQKRLEEEQGIVRHYYDKLLSSAAEEQKEAIQSQYDSRKGEIDWQFRPRVTASAINCGIFHLAGIG